MSYIVHMSTTITIRTDEALRKALASRASAAGKTLSEIIREILEDAVVARPVGTRAGKLRGRLRLSRKTSEAWRKRLRERNWRT